MPAGNDLRARLARATGLYRGRGDGPETGPFLARMVVGTAVDGRVVTLDYEATSDSNGLQHVEHTLLVAGESGRLELHVASLELPGVVRFTEQQPGQFTAYEGPLVARIMLSLPRAGAISYAWWWSRGEAEPHEQSRAELRHAG
ncbi:MAG TPA: hypothetical protein VFX61_15735 [Micromonosporaceae bacterium]|nr:hypothetical protein [Micromonosporaceae bacterium]